MGAQHLVIMGGMFSLIAVVDVVVLAFVVAPTGWHVNIYISCFGVDPPSPDRLIGWIILYLGCIRNDIGTQIGISFAQHRL